MSLVRLDIPFRSQWDDDAADHESDCGPTCVAMLLNGLGIDITPDETYHHIGKRGRRAFTSFTDLRNAALSGGSLTLTFEQQRQRQAALDALKNHIDNGRSLIALINYAEWRERTGNQFSSGHFIVVTGYDDTSIYIHDPLFGLWALRSRGTHYKWSKRKFLDAWGGFDITENPNFASLVTDSRFPFETNDNLPTDKPIIEMPTLTDEHILHIVSLAAYEGEATPNLNDPATAVAWLDRLGSWGEEVVTYTVNTGDTFSSIARRFYHDPLRWRAIQQFNQLTNSSLFVGQQLQIPLPGERDPASAPGPHQPAIIDPDVRVLLPRHGGPIKTDIVPI